MPARRPYANRGVPQRPTTRRSGRAGSATGFAALVAVLVVIGAATVWVINPFSSARQPGAPLLPGASTGASAASATADFAAPGLPLAPAAEVAPAANASGATPIPMPTVRRWDTAAAGILPDAALASVLDQALVGVDGHVSVAVKDLATGR